QQAGSPHVAIKEVVLSHYSSADDKREAITCFRREVSILLTLADPAMPAIPGIHSHWSAHPTDGQLYLVMDCIPGKTLEELLQAGPVPWQRVARWGAALG